MRSLALARPGERLKLLCLGAHADDIEIGAGATILGLMASGVRIDVDWVVLSAAGARNGEAEASARSFLEGAAAVRIDVQGFRDGYFAHEGARLKDWFEELKLRVDPDVVLTHHRDDAHQDHRLVAELTQNTFRNHLTLAYEIPKWDGDLGRPNVFMPAGPAVMARKVALLMQHFATQRSKDWFDEATFMGLARLRGMECRAPDRLAEAFHSTKLVLV
jgi:LmbE family N-acetylglucosaminyl deacetylase